MGHYDDFYKAKARADLLRRYGPAENAVIEVTEKEVRYWVARANKAECALRGIKRAWDDLFGIIEEL